MLTRTQKFCSLGAAAAFALFAFGAQAQQQKAPEKAAPAAAAPKAKAAPKPKSACNAIADQAGCTANTTCQWIKALMDDKGKQKRKAYCRTKTAPPKKKAADAPKK